MKSWTETRWLPLYVLAVFALLAPVLVPKANAQDAANPPSQTSTEQPASQGDGDEPQEPLFSTEIEIVTLPVTVTDGSGEFVTDLDRGDFHLLDNGSEQRIDQFELTSEPLSMVVVVQTSSRVEANLPEIRRAGILLTQLVLGETGEAALIAFDRNIKLVQGFTSDPDKVESAMKSLAPGAEDVRLSDALSRALVMLQQRPKERRKVILVISEARDSSSANAPGLVLRSAQQLGISVYTVALSSMRNLFSKPQEAAPSPYPAGVMARPSQGNFPSTPDTQAQVGAAHVELLPMIAELVASTKTWMGGNPLELYAAGTGAEDFSGGGNSQLEQALGRIGSELRNQYLLSYRPNNLDDPAFHYIQVLVKRPGVEVRTRPGYMFTRGGRTRPAAPPAQAAPSGVTQ